MRLSCGEMRAGHASSTGSLSCRGTQHAAKRRTYRAIFVCSQGIDTLHAAAGTHEHQGLDPSSQRTAHQSESIPAIRVNPCNPSLFDCSTGDPSQPESIHYYILLHILKIISIFGLYASVHAEMVVQHCLYISTMLRRCGLYQQMVIKC